MSDNEFIVVFICYVELFLLVGFIFLGVGIKIAGSILRGFDG